MPYTLQIALQQTGLGDLQKHVPSIMESVNSNVKDSRVVMLNKSK